MSSDGNGSVIIAPDGTQYECKGSGLPQTMTFEYDGAEHSIFMDLGTHGRAYQLYRERNFGELLKFPVWAGQKHDYEAYKKRQGEEQTKA